MVNPKTVCLIIGHKVTPHTTGYYDYYCPRCGKTWEGEEGYVTATALQEMNSGSTLAIIIIVILFLFAASCNAAITDDFLNRVAMVESGNRAGAVGDGGKALGLFQFHAEAWADCSEIRKANGLKVYPYYCATNAYIARLYSGTWFQYLHSRLSLDMKRTPSDAHVFAAHNMGYRGFKTRGFDLRKVPKVTKNSLAKLNK